MRIKKSIGLFIGTILMIACSQTNTNIPVIGFADAFEDNTIEQAKDGFTDALMKNGFDEKKNTIKIIYRNAQGNIPTLTQIVKYIYFSKSYTYCYKSNFVYHNCSSEHKRYSGFYDGFTSSRLNET